MLTRQGPFTSPVVTVEVDDIDKALDTIASQGGATVRGKEPVTDMGFAAYFTDTKAT